MEPLGERARGARRVDAPAHKLEAPAVAVCSSRGLELPLSPEAPPGKVEVEVEVEVEEVDKVWWWLRWYGGSRGTHRELAPPHAHARHERPLPPDVRAPAQRRRRPRGSSGRMDQNATAIPPPSQRGRGWRRCSGRRCGRGGRRRRCRRCRRGRVEQRARPSRSGRPPRKAGHPQQQRVGSRTTSARTRRCCARVSPTRAESSCIDFAWSAARRRRDAPSSSARAPFGAGAAVGELAPLGQRLGVRSAAR